MNRLKTPEGFTPSGRTDAEIRANIPNIPLMDFLSVTTSPQIKEALRLAWWEEIVLQRKDLDEEEAYQEKNRRENN